MRRDQVDELARSNNLRFLPEFWEMSLIARYEVIGSGCVGTGDEFVIFRVVRHSKRGRDDALAATIDELKKLFARALSDTKLWTA
jgi:hypothetical protein